MRSARSLPWQLAFIVLGAIWGCSFLFIKLGLESLSPIGVAFFRLAIGAVTLLAVSAATKTPLPRSASTWRHLAVLALLFCSIPFTLFAWGETQVSSILAGIINATTPLTTLVAVLVAFPEERPTRERIAGLLVGFAGVLVVVGVWDGIGGGELAGVLACVGAVTCYGIVYPYSRRHLFSQGSDPIAIATGQVVLGALFLLPVVAGEALLGNPVVRWPVSAATVVAMVCLGVLGSGIAYVLSFRIVKAAGATTASSVTYVTPLFAVIAGVLLLSEPLTWHEPVGGLIVLAGVAIAQGRFRWLVPLSRNRKVGG
jgi:drug/metabolite transporter (DMT)-like permease